MKSRFVNNGKVCLDLVTRAIIGQGYKNNIACDRSKCCHPNIMCSNCLCNNHASF